MMKPVLRLMVLLVTQNLGQRGAVFLYQQSACPRTFKIENQKNQTKTKPKQKTQKPTKQTGHLSQKGNFLKF